MLQEAWVTGITPPYVQISYKRRNLTLNKMARPIMNGVSTGLHWMPQMGDSVLVENLEGSQPLIICGGPNVDLTGASQLLPLLAGTGMLGGEAALFGPDGASLGVYSGGQVRAVSPVNDGVYLYLNGATDTTQTMRFYSDAFADHLVFGQKWQSFQANNSGANHDMAVGIPYASILYWNFQDDAGDGTSYASFTLTPQNGSAYGSAFCINGPDGQQIQMNRVNTSMAIYSGSGGICYFGAAGVLGGSAIARNGDQTTIVVGGTGYSGGISATCPYIRG